jgi:hypothetical protein
LFVIESTHVGPTFAARRDPRSPRKHAFIEPAAAMPLASMQTGLCSTRSKWERKP